MKMRRNPRNLGGHAAGEKTYFIRQEQCFCDRSRRTQMQVKQLYRLNKKERREKICVWN